MLAFERDSLQLAAGGPSTLELGYNNITDAGVVALAKALEKGALPKLRELYMQHNFIGDEGAKALKAVKELRGQRLKAFWIPAGNP